MSSVLKASLVLENGKTFEGYSFGSTTPVTGEVVFNTGMVGYPQTMTDPSYKEQILNFTYPLIGNYGVPENTKDSNNISKFFESEKIQVKGIIVSDYSYDYSHYQAVKSLDAWMKEQNIPGITGLNTRELTQTLREKGSMLGKIIIEKKTRIQKMEDPNKRNLVAEVSTKEPVEYGSGKKTIAVLDYGVKNNILRSLLKRKIKVLKLPWDYDLFEHSEKFDGIVLSNGPGDPKIVTESINIVKKALETNTPTFGICLGNQLLALAAGANTYKLKFGHRSQNQPCIMQGTNSCQITSQNHGFAVDAKTLPKGWKEWFFNANDQTNEGIIHEKKPFMSVQFHPEAFPGPVDSNYLFDYFLKVVK